MKTEMKVPKSMNDADITSILKQKSSREEMSNQRGIFGITIWKKILDYLLYNDYYNAIDSTMTDSNIGGRKKRMAKDHLFIVYGIISSVVNEKEESIDLQIYDIEKAFDKLNLKDTLNELVEDLPDEIKNDKISLLYESNKVTNVSVKTPLGNTKRIQVKEVVQQGGVWGPILCSKSLDSHGRKFLKEEKLLYKYKGTRPEAYSWPPAT